MQAPELYEKYHLLNSVIELSKSASLEEGQAAAEGGALELAQKIICNSPDAVLVTKHALNLSRDYGGQVPQGSHEDADTHAREGSYPELMKGDLEDIAAKGYSNVRARALYVGENLSEGLLAFKEVRGIFQKVRFETDHGCCFVYRNAPLGGKTRSSSPHRLPRPSCNQMRNVSGRRDAEKHDSCRPCGSSSERVEPDTKKM